MADEMSVDAFVRNFEDAVEGIEPNTLTPETEFDALEEWDSLAALSVLAMVDAEYDAEVSGNELRNAKTLGNLFEIIRSKK